MPRSKRKRKLRKILLKMKKKMKIIIKIKPIHINVAQMPIRIKIMHGKLIIEWVQKSLAVLQQKVELQLVDHRGLYRLEWGMFQIYQIQQTGLTGILQLKTKVCVQILILFSSIFIYN